VVGSLVVNGCGYETEATGYSIRWPGGRGRLPDELRWRACQKLLLPWGRVFLQLQQQLDENLYRLEVYLPAE
jgi:hypothetical protein